MKYNKAMKKIVVGMSGGVDSSVAAALLKEQGHEVLGVHMQNWHDKRFIRGCSNWPEDRKDALRVARLLGTPFEVVNFAKEYKQRVIEHFFADYAAGRTPNPDVLCNREIKFGMLLDWAKARGYEAVATGHYAQVEHGVGDGDKGIPGQSRLFRGIDRTKDQSYFLAQLSQEQLRHAVFPLGGMLKRDVRAVAAERKLPVADKPDSQGLCFVGEIDLSGFLQQRIPAKAGEVVGSDGELLGEHEGAPFYTVGQRRGIGVAKGVPMYVLKTDIAANTVTIGHDHELYRTELQTEPAHWVAGSPPDDAATVTDGRYDVAIRYRMEPAEATVTQNADGGFQITFDEPQRGPTPGQFAVLYRGDELVGSAVIR